MISNEFKAYIDDLKSKQLTVEALLELIEYFDLNHPNFSGFRFRDELNPKGLLLTAEGNEENGISIHVPQNILDFDLALVSNLLMHEVYHIHQRIGLEKVETREEREWQAYYEMIFHEKFPQIPPLNQFYINQFGKKALNYYNSMNIDLKAKYQLQKIKLENLLQNLAKNNQS